jgi:hypothetical protein
MFFGGDGKPPHEKAKDFFFAMMDNRCQQSWSSFSTPSQNYFADWTLNQLAHKNKMAVQQAALTLKEVRLMFEGNDPSLMKYFWKHFFINSGAGEIYRFGTFGCEWIKGKNAMVRVSLKYPNGKHRDIGLPMIKERTGWKLAYVENKLPF